jgi:hypothetical protein
MNPDTLTRLLTAAQGAIDALGHGSTEIDRLAARNQLQAALHEVTLGASTRKQTSPEFDGTVYDPAADKDRLSNQLGRVFQCMRDGEWRTLDEIHKTTLGEPVASISAQLRHLRKPRFGSYRVEKRHRGDPAHGLFEYRLLPPDGRIQREVPDVADLKDVTHAEIL